MTIATDRTAEERAAAWDYVMSSTEGESVAITKAWCVETENVVPSDVVQVHDREFGYVPGDDARS